MKWWYLSLAMTCVFALEASGAVSVDEAVRQSGVRGGLVVHIGCGNGRETAALRSRENYLVHGLDTDPAAIQIARRHITSLNLQGPVTVDLYDGKNLPYVDNLANVVVVSSDVCGVSGGELERVLAPRGVLLVRRDARVVHVPATASRTAPSPPGWIQWVKPVPTDIDEWPHFLHGADNNAVANDTVVGPPRHLQWVADPLWMRYHHTLAGISAMVTSGGRIFYVLDDSPAASINIPSQWQLYARDAFNGVFLWKRPISSWASQAIRFRSGPVDLPRRLVSVGDQVFVTLTRGGPVSILDAATGDTLRVLEETKQAEEIICSDGVLLVLTGDPEAQQAAQASRRRGQQPKKSGKKQRAKSSNTRAVGSDIMAFDAATGQLLWKRRQDPGSVLPQTLAAASGRVYFQSPVQLVCLDLKDGAEVWQADRKVKLGANYFAPTLVVSEGVVLSADNTSLEAFSADKGTRLWSCTCRATFRSPVDVLVVNGTVWLGQEFSVGRDLQTGEVTKTNSAAGKLATVGHHHRCYRNKATERYIIGGYRGMEYHDLLGQHHSRNNWVRGVCQYGIMPANGLNYAPPHACGCYPEAKLFGFYALAGEGSRVRGRTSSRSKGPRSETGPAFGHLGEEVLEKTDWPTFRYDVLRSGGTPAKIPGELQQAWTTSLGGNLSAVTVAEGKLFVASIDRHTVHCLDAASGKRLWDFTAGGRVDSPPTLFRGTALLGSADGYVYCLRASDGALAWRFRAGPTDSRTVARDRLESVWPVHGSVLVLNGIAYVAAGRSSYLDGGIHLVGLDPATGQLVCQETVESRSPDFQQSLAKQQSTQDIPDAPDQNKADWKTVADPDQSDAFSMGGGAISDVLVSDGDSVYMRQLQFDRELRRLPGKGRHLFSTSSLLDGNENHRSHWMLGNFEMAGLPVAYSWIANRRGGRKGTGFTVPYGLMLSFNHDTAWCVWRSYGKEQPLLYARSIGSLPKQDALDSDFGLLNDKDGTPVWSVPLEIRTRALIRAGGNLILAGRLNRDTASAFDGRDGGSLVVVSAADGSQGTNRRLKSPPVWDGMAAANGRLFVACENGAVVCFQ